MAQLGPKPLDPASVERFRQALKGLVGPRQRLGIAVSGGPDSLALLLLANALRPNLIAAATVDHKLREESAMEAAKVARLCEAMNIPHTILTVAWGQKPTANLQARAREKRLSALIHWAQANDLPAIAMAHHADDQAETVLMRLARGAGLAGLAGARRAREVAPGIRLVRPLIGWRRSDLGSIVDQAGVEPVLDPSNEDPAHDRTRIRQAIADAQVGDIANIARSAAHLADAEVAMEWITDGMADMRFEPREGGGLLIDPEGLPFEIRRRLLLRSFDRFERARPRGPATIRLMRALADGKIATLGGLRFESGEKWTVTRPAPRRAGDGVAPDPASSTENVLDLN